MTAKQKIEELTNGWYGFALFGAALSLLKNGLGFFSLAGTAASLLFSFFVTWFLGRRLLNRSSLFRVLLVVLSGLSVCFGVLAVGKLGLMFLGSFSMSLILPIALGIGSIVMNGRSFRVLTDSSVKAYFG